MKKIFVVGVTLSLSACAHSKEEMDQQLRENEALMKRVSVQQRAHNKCEAEHAAALSEIDDLKKKLLARGVNLDNLAESLEEQRRANEEYRRRTEQLVELRARFNKLRARLQELSASGLSVEVRDNRMLIQLPADTLFDTGGDRLKRSGKQLLTQVAKAISEDPDLLQREFQVAAHTDKKQPKGGRFADNWALSAMRAQSVLKFLIDDKKEGGGLSQVHFSAAGYASESPIADNDSEAGRAKNRRIELVVLPNAEEMLNLGSLTR